MKTKATAIHYLIAGLVMLAAALPFSLSYGSEFPFGLLSMTISLCATIALFRGMAMLNSAGLLVFSAKPILSGAAAALPCGLSILLSLVGTAWFGLYENAGLVAWVGFVAAWIGGMFSFILAGLRLAKKGTS
jgi:hypothetical protein